MGILYKFLLFPTSWLYQKE